MQEIKLTVAGDNAPIPLTVESGKIIHDGGLPDGGTTGQVLTKVSDQDGDADWQTPSGGAVQDVQVAGTSVVQNGVANVPVAGNGAVGVTRPNIDRGLQMVGDSIGIIESTTGSYKNGISKFFAVNIAHQHESTFFGLAKAALADMAGLSSVTVGQYPEAQKSAISTMLNGPVTVSGTTPSITALPGIQYVCGEVATLDITLPASGCVDVVFESGSTPTVLTITPPAGMTVEWANSFDSTALEANTLYEINIKMVGTKCLGVAGAWT